MRRFLAGSVVMLLATLAACGGKEAASLQAVTDSGSPPSADDQGATTPQYPGPTGPPPAGAPVPPPADLLGVWVMVQLDGYVGVASTEPVPPIEVEFLEDGTVYRGTCAVGPYAPDAGKKTACTASSVMDCLRGTGHPQGDQWHVDIPQIFVGNVPEQGEVIRETGGTILIRYINPTFSGGHFVRVADTAEAAACRGR
ncbi:MAG: hypothetical protein JWM74_2982 [Myxococcaceae bacterium]|nr:hypothetical protein [Myxococcaceae bacterium]